MRSVSKDDFGDTLVGWINDQDVTRYLTRGNMPGHPAALQQEYLELINSTVDLQLAICLKHNSQYVGIAGLHSLDWVARSGEFRILIGEKNAWGQGAGTEAAQLITAYAFETLNLNKVWLGVNASNERAFKSYEKAGYVNEGKLRQEVFRNGRYYDVYRMSILRPEYERARNEWSLNTTIERQLRG